MNNVMQLEALDGGAGPAVGVRAGSAAATLPAPSPTAAAASRGEVNSAAEVAGVPAGPPVGDRPALSPHLRPHGDHGWERRWGKMNLGLLAAENFSLPWCLSVMTIMTTFSRILGSRCSKQVVFDRLCCVPGQSLLAGCPLQSWRVSLTC